MTRCLLVAPEVIFCMNRISPFEHVSYFFFYVNNSKKKWNIQEEAYKTSARPLSFFSFVTFFFCWYYDCVPTQCSTVHFFLCICYSWWVMSPMELLVTCSVYGSSQCTACTYRGSVCFCTWL